MSLGIGAAKKGCSCFYTFYVALLPDSCLKPAVHTPKSRLNAVIRRLRGGRKARARRLHCSKTKQKKSQKKCLTSIQMCTILVVNKGALYEKSINRQAAGDFKFPGAV